MDRKVGELEGGSKDKLSKGNEQDGKVDQAESISKRKDIKVENADSNNHLKEGEDEKTVYSESSSKQKEEKVENAKAEHSDPNEQSKGGNINNAESIKKSQRVGNTESISRSKGGKVKAGNTQVAKYTPKRKKRINKTSGAAKLKGKFRSFGENVKKLWDVWGRFKTKNTQKPNPSISEKTLGVPGFEEIACIEAEVPDIMMMDMDRVRTSCKECMKDPPTFPSKEQIKAKLIAADKYYGVKSAKREPAGTAFEHEADYQDTDGRVVRPSWRFILERPLVEQYVLMTNYIRKVSVLSELKDDSSSKKYIEEEDSGSDTEYKKFEQKFIKEKQELLKPIQKPKTQDMAVQTSFEPKRESSEDLKESVSEISLYPESEESTSSPEASAVTIVTSRDYASPLQSDFDGKTTDKSTSNRGGNWWESQATCEPSESFQTSFDSINKNTSSGSDGQSVPIHPAWGKTILQPTKEAFSNESDSRITSHRHSIQPSTHKKLKDSKKVSFSPVVTYYQGPNKNAPLYNLPEGQDIATEMEREEPRQHGKETGNPSQNPVAANSGDEVKPAALDTRANHITESPPDRITEKKSVGKEELPNSVVKGTLKPTNRKAWLGNVLLDKKRGQIVSVSLPSDWNEERVFRNKKTINVAVSRTPAASQSVTQKVSFQDYEDIPDVEYSNPQITTVLHRTDANIQTKTPMAQKSTPAGSLEPKKWRKLSPPEQPVENQSPWNPQSKIRPTDDAPTALTHGLPNDELTLSERLRCGGMESMRTEIYVQTPPSRSPKVQERLRTTEERFDDYIATAEHASRSGAMVQRNSVKTEAHKSWITSTTPRRDNSPYFQPQMEDTQSAKDLHVGHNADPDEKPTDRILKIPHNFSLTRDKSPIKQQHSTDTDGPSSSSNEHIKLKASPPCFFKVATPTDLSKISVDEFYPDVPEIDAEISQISETKTSSAPQVEIVFANKESALRYIKDSELHRVARKEENAILQKSSKTIENDGQTAQKAPCKGKTIIASPGVGIKIDERLIDKSKDVVQDKSGNILAVKAPTKNSSQQSNITQNIRKSSLLNTESKSESEGEPPVIKYTQTRTCKKDLGITALKVEKILNNEVMTETIKLEAKSTNAQVEKAASKTSSQQRPEEMTSRQKVQLPQLTSNVPTTEEHLNGLSEECKEHLNGLSEEGKEQLTGFSEEGNETTMHKNKVIEIKEAGNFQGTGKAGGIGKYENTVNDEDDDKITIQRQLDSLSLESGEQLVASGRTKAYMRTLSSLAEETSSAVDSTSSSAQEKVIDMPAVARSVEELKTIFEKKLEVSSVSGESEIQGVESGGGSQTGENKCTVLPKEKFDNTGARGKLVSAEIIAATEEAKNTISHVQHKLDGKLTTMREGEATNSQGNLAPALVTLEMSTIGTEQAKDCPVKADKPIKSENSICGIEKNTNVSGTIQEESSVQQHSQIDVIKASEIYSNTSMYASSSEDRGAKLTKARTGFQPVTLDDDLASIASCRDAKKTSNENINGPHKSHLGSSKTSTSRGKLSRTNSASQINSDSNPKEIGIKLKTNHEGDNLSVGQSLKQTLADTKHIMRKEKREIEEAQEPSSMSTTAIKKLQENELTDPIPKSESKMTDTSNSSETKQWLMDAIPILSKNSRFHGFKPHKPICVKEATEAEAVKYRQDAVKPVFRFLKRQREMEENKE